MDLTSHEQQGIRGLCGYCARWKTGMHSTEQCTLYLDGNSKKPKINKAHPMGANIGYLFKVSYIAKESSLVFWKDLKTGKGI